MVCVKNVIKKILDINGVKHVMQNIFNKILKNGLVVMLILTNLFKILSYQQIIMIKYQSVYLMIDFMILNILQKAGLAKSIEQIGLMVIYGIGIIQIKIGNDLIPIDRKSVV